VPVLLDPRHRVPLRPDGPFGAVVVCLDDVVVARGELLIVDPRRVVLAAFLRSDVVDDRPGMATVPAIVTDALGFIGSTPDVIVFRRDSF
jgi:hypothetical protein